MDEQSDIWAVDASASQNGVFPYTSIYLVGSRYCCFIKYSRFLVHIHVIHMEILLQEAISKLQITASCIQSPVCHCGSR